MASVELEIAAAREGDAEALLPLIQAFFEEEAIETSAARQRANLSAMLSDDRATILLARSSGRIVGFVTSTLTTGIEFGRSAEIEDLYVVPEVRGCGLAHRLMDAAQQWCRDKGVGEVIVVVTPEGQEQQDLLSFYHRFGFRESGRSILYRTLEP